MSLLTDFVDREIEIVCVDCDRPGHNFDYRMTVHQIRVRVPARKAINNSENYMYVERLAMSDVLGVHNPPGLRVRTQFDRRL